MSNFYKPELNKKLDIQKEKPSSYVGEDIIDSVDYALKVERLKEKRISLRLKLLSFLGAWGVIFVFLCFIYKSSSVFLTKILDSFLISSEPVLLWTYGLGIFSMIAVVVSLSIALIRTTFKDSKNESAQIETSYTALAKEIKAVSSEQEDVAGVLDKLIKIIEILKK